ncbi:hypothetical protein PAPPERLAPAPP_01990 [Brevundimonas phage vB_BpoS-Papperlapapp]|nr:hypothetical protein PAPPERLAPAPP_01990 [Brevundimonas phage vB_BpoS-Papperlapapp]
MGDSRTTPLVTVVAFLAAAIIFVVGLAAGVSSQTQQGEVDERRAVLKDLADAEQMICTEPAPNASREQCVGAGRMRAFVWARLSHREIQEPS